MLIVNKTVKSYKVTAKKMQQGVALLESLIALLIFSMGILAIVGLQGFMVKSTADSKARSDASFLAQNRIAMMWADPLNPANYAEVGTAVPALPGGLRTTTVNVLTRGEEEVAEVEVLITWQLPGEAQHRYRAIAQISGARPKNGEA